MTPTTGKKGAYRPSDPIGYLKDSHGDLYPLADIYVHGLKDSNVKESSVLKDSGFPVWEIDSGGERYYTTTQRINDCVFRATKKYMEAVGLGTLTTGDEDFFRDHPRVGPDGVGRANVLCVIQGLVAPWGLGVDHVWMPKWMSLGDQHKKFAAALGINPAAATDSETSNEEFAKGAKLDRGSEIAKTIMSCGFEFIDKPQAPCIVLLSSYGSTAKKTGGANVGGTWGVGFSGMGHADFIGPRDRILGDWEIALSLTRDPIYADNAITEYGDLSYFGKENDLKKDGLLNLSTTQSLVGGKAISSYSNKAAAITRYVPGVTTTKEKCPECQGVLGGTAGSRYCHLCKWRESKSVATQDSPTDLNALVKPSSRNCPWCGGVTGDASGTEFCYSCNWFWSKDSDALGVICPFCDGAIINNLCNRDCGYSITDWIESQKWQCSKHRTTMFYTYVNEKENKGIYLCPVCTRDSKKSVAELRKAESTHDRADRGPA